MSIGHGKGSLLIHSRDYVRKQHGERVWEKLVTDSSSEDREILQGILLRGGWYPIGVINRLTDRLCVQHATGPAEDEMRRLSAHIADSDLGTVYKMVIRMGSPEFLVKRTGSLWNRYFDVGDMTASEVGARHWRLTLHMEVGEDAAPSFLYCGPGCPSWIEMGLRLTGAASAKVDHVGCRHDNGKYCTYDVTW